MCMPMILLWYVYLFRLDYNMEVGFISTKEEHFSNLEYEGKTICNPQLLIRPFIHEILRRTYNVLRDSYKAVLFVNGPIRYIYRVK